MPYDENDEYYSDEEQYDDDDDEDGEDGGGEVEVLQFEFLTAPGENTPAPILLQPLTSSTTVQWSTLDTNEVVTSGGFVPPPYFSSSLFRCANLAWSGPHNRRE